MAKKKTTSKKAVVKTVICDADKVHLNDGTTIYHGQKTEVSNKEAGQLMKNGWVSIAR